MSDRVHLKVELELLVDDAGALRQSAFERLQAAWSSDDAFPYESADDVPLDQAISSALGDAIPIQFPGARRSQITVDAESVDSSDTASEDSEDTDDTDDTDDEAEKPR